jgi:hypothetical protein
MARGFESKHVEAQQDEARRERAPRRTLAPGEAERLDRRRTLELARARLTSDLQRVTHAAHRTMIESALTALDDQLRALRAPPEV